MFGKIRASSCPAESLERPPSKIFKDDSLSIYEATLMKLKLGSKRNLGPCSDEVGETDTTGSTSRSPDSEPMKIEANCASSAGTSPGCIEAANYPQEEFMTLDTDCSSPRSSMSFSDCHSAGTSKQQQGTNISVLYLFSKFKRAQEASCSFSGDAMMTENAGISPSSGGCQSFNSTEQSEQECVNSLPASQICML
ncbi:hypothetical protein ACFX13_015519 [Malus domestica]|uniref:Uncharacterized protein n=1 Tax=Malus domestica TaxID=3750 RepID=A0A498I6R9_MALDO|nr:uncharacterized protein LOC103431110 [Malus domestica]XP_050123584.1 uncharacterized protein LOC126600923 [Malus sylvestris]RXH77775.1 hypothetical protein DVH24_039746 [Malus domestica]